MHSIDQHAGGLRCAILRRAVLIALSLLLIAAPSQASRILQVRVGNHPTFTRLVFEMDTFSGYQVERRTGDDGTEQLVVTLDASTPLREITSKSVGIESVRVLESDGQAIAQIRLRKPGLQMKEMILSNPPRIVLDFVHSAAAVAQLKGDPYAKPKPAPKPEIAKVAKPKPAPKPEIAKVEKPKPAPKPEIAKVEKPKPAPKPEIAKVEKPKPAPTPEIAKVEKPKPAPKPEIAKVEKPKPAPKPEIAKVEKPKPAPKPEIAKVEKPKLAPKPEIAKVEKPKPAPKLEIAKVEKSEPETTLAGAADDGTKLRDSTPGVHKRDERKLPNDVPLGSTTRTAKPSTDQKQHRTPSPADVNRRIDKPKPADSGMPFNTVTMAGIAAGALIVLVVAVRIFRKRSLPKNLDVTSFADAFEDDAPNADNETADSETSDRIPAEGFSMDESPADDPEPQVEEQNTAAYSLSEVAANANEPETGLYNEDSEGDKPMDMDTSNLPTERADFVAPPASVTTGGGDDVSQLVQELASRIANLETRLDEANDGRERLERQVAAQSEELRVQRAAIARTQRALRSLSRAEEDQATEPALREPSQPAG
jgi:hypothetical protein